MPYLPDDDTLCMLCFGTKFLTNKNIIFFALVGSNGFITKCENYLFDFHNEIFLLNELFRRQVVHCRSGSGMFVDSSPE